MRRMWILFGLAIAGCARPDPYLTLTIEQPGLGVTEFHVDLKQTESEIRNSVEKALLTLKNSRGTVEGGTLVGRIKWSWNAPGRIEGLKRKPDSWARGGRELHFDGSQEPPYDLRRDSSERGASNKDAAVLLTRLSDEIVRDVLGFVRTEAPDVLQGK